MGKTNQLLIWRIIASLVEKHYMDVIETYKNHLHLMEIITELINWLTNTSFELSVVSTFWCIPAELRQHYWCFCEWQGASKNIENKHRTQHFYRDGFEWLVFLWGVQSVRNHSKQVINYRIQQLSWEVLASLVFLWGDRSSREHSEQLITECSILAESC